MKKAWTEYGEVSFELVTCASCDMERPKEGCQRVVTGDVRKKHSRHSYAFDADTKVEGWVCEDCVGTFAGMPEPGFSYVLFLVSMAVGIVMGWFMAMVWIGPV